MFGVAVLGDGEAHGGADGLEEVEDLGVAIVEGAVGAPADDHEVGAFGEFDDGCVVVWADGVFDLLESLWIGGSQGEDIGDIHRRESPRNSVAVASCQGWIEDFGVGGGGVE